MEPIEWDKQEDASLKELPNTIRAAEDKKNPDPNAKRRLLVLFCSQVDAANSAGKTPTPYPELLKYLSRQFDQALQSELAAPALARLLLGGPRNRTQNPENHMRDEILALEVDELIRRGKTPNECYMTVMHKYIKAGDTSVSRDTVKRAWLKHRDSPLLKDPLID